MNTARAPEGAKIGWIGLGKMGLPICERLAAHAFPVTALTRSTERQAAEVGARSASGTSGAVDGAGIVMSDWTKGRRGEGEDINGFRRAGAGPPRTPLARE